MSGTRGSIAVVTALREEFEAVLSRTRGARFRGAHVEGRIGTAEIALCLTGDGAQSASRGAARLCESVRPAALLGAGVAGALSPDLAVGELLVSSRIRDSEGEVSPPDEELLSRALEIGGVIAGTLVTVGRPMVSGSEKAAFAGSLNGLHPAAADMESAAWARAAASRRVPYLVLRSISDRVEEDLPEYLARCLGARGGIRRSSVVLHALARPDTIPALLTMRTRVRDGAERLAAFLEAFLAAGQPS
jgi:adenosylhomocysteine nucleosidase